MEDCQYVMDSDSDSITRWTVEELESFLLNGVIVFGDRDNYDYFLHEARIESFISDNNFKVLKSYSG